MPALDARGVGVGRKVPTVPLTGRGVAALRAQSRVRPAEVLSFRRRRSSRRSTRPRRQVSWARDVERVPA